MSGVDIGYDDPLDAPQFGSGDIGHGNDPDLEDEPPIPQYEEFSGPIIPVDEFHIYEVNIGGDTADTLLGEGRFIPFEFQYGRKSPLKFFIEVSDGEVIEVVRYLQMIEHDKDITITRAPANWKL